MSGPSEPKKPASLSCNECRRSKLKCDRVFPCQACIRRGCADLCPDGTMTPVKGNKVLEAHAEQLEDQVKTLQRRIADLERQSASTPQGIAAKFAGQPWSIPETVNLHELGPSPKSAVADVTVGIGSLSMGLQGQFRYHGETAGSEYIQELLHTPEREPKVSVAALNLPREILDLLKHFPMGQRDYIHSPYVFTDFLPSRERSLALVDIYYRKVTWMYDPIRRSCFMSEVFNEIYPPDDDSPHANLKEIAEGCPHRLSVFFLVLAFAVRHDRGALDVTALSNHYVILAKASYSLACLAHDVGVHSVLALFLYTQYLYNYDRHSTEERWFISGIANRAVQSIGLQRDCVAWSLEDDMVQLRRVLFYENFLHDSWQSLVLGRAPSLLIQHTDCPFPDLHNSEIEYHDWAWRYAARCLSPVLEHVFNTIPLCAGTILELDKNIRKFPIPLHLRAPVHADDIDLVWSPNPHLAMQQYAVVSLKESSILSLHRAHFAAAVSRMVDPLKHLYSFSVLAVYRSACRLILGLRGLMQVHPESANKCWLFWSGILSACIVLGALVVESPGCSLSAEAIHKLEEGIAFFEQGSTSCAPPSSVSMLKRLLGRASEAYGLHSSGMPQTTPDDSDPDEIAVLGGRKPFIQPKQKLDTPSPPQFPTTAEMEASMDFYDGGGSSASSGSSQGSPSSWASNDLHLQNFQDPNQHPFEPTLHGAGPMFAVGPPQPPGTVYDPFSPSVTNSLSHHTHHNSVGPVRHRHQAQAAAYRPSPYPTHLRPTPQDPFGSFGMYTGGWTDPALEQGEPLRYVPHDAFWNDFQKSLGVNPINSMNY